MHLYRSSAIFSVRASPWLGAFSPRHATPDQPVTTLEMAHQRDSDSGAGTVTGSRYKTPTADITRPPQSAHAQAPWPSWAFLYSWPRSSTLLFDRPRGCTSASTSGYPNSSQNRRRHHQRYLSRSRTTTTTMRRQASSSSKNPHLLSNLCLLLLNPLR